MLPLNRSTSPKKVSIPIKYPFKGSSSILIRLLSFIATEPVQILHEILPIMLIQKVNAPMDAWKRLSCCRDVHISPLPRSMAFTRGEPILRDLAGSCIGKGYYQQPVDGTPSFSSCSIRSTSTAVFGSCRRCYQQIILASIVRCSLSFGLTLPPFLALLLVSVQLGIIYRYPLSSTGCQTGRFRCRGVFELYPDLFSGFNPTYVGISMPIRLAFLI